MEKKLLKHLMFLIAFTVFLILLIIRFDEFIHLILQVLTLFRPIFIGFAIAFILHRPCSFFYKHYNHWLSQTKAVGAARPLAVATSYLMLITLITLLISFVVPQLTSSIALFASNLNTIYIPNLQNWINFLVNRFDFGFLQSLDLSNFTDTLKNLLSRALSMVYSTIPQLFSLTGALISVIITAFLALIFSIYMLAGGERLLAQIKRFMQAYLPEKITSPLFEVVELTADIFTRFITGQLIEACILTCLCFTGMSIFRFQYAPLISVLIGVCALIPIAGAFIGASISALLLLMISPVQAMWFLVFLLTLQQLEGNIIYPRVVGTSIGLPPIWVLTAITIGGGMFGFVGILVSVPTVSVLYALLKRDVAHRTLRKHPS